MKKKTKQDFQETIKAEHCECCSMSYVCLPLSQSDPWPRLPQAQAASRLGVPCVATVLPVPCFGSVPRS